MQVGKLLKYVILGAPRSKKNHMRIVRIRGRPVPIQGKANMGWQKSAIEQLVAQRTAPFPVAAPVAVRATFYRDRRIGDLVNFMQALADALEKGGVIVNDRQIESWDGTRLGHDKDNPRVEVEVVPL